MTIKLPTPAYVIVPARPGERRTAEEIAVVVRVTENRRAPPVGQADPFVRVVDPLVAMTRKFIVVVIRVELHEQRNLLQVVHAMRPLALGFCLCQCRQKHPSQDRDDCDDDEKFYESKTCPRWFRGSHMLKLQWYIRCRDTCHPGK